MVLRPGAFGQTGSSDGVSTPPGPGPGPIWDPKFKNRSFWGKKRPCGLVTRQTKLVKFQKWIFWGKKPLRAGHQADNAYVYVQKIRVSVSRK